MILVDTSGLVANYDRSDRHHGDVLRTLQKPERKLLSPFVLAEVDYLIWKIAGQDAELRVLGDVARGAYQLESFGAADIAAAQAVIRRYADLGLGLTDASIVVLANRYGCFDLLTLDHRHFRTVVGAHGEPFRLLPADLPRL